MIRSKQRYVVDDDGNRLGVVLDIAEYQRILQDIEELESIRAYDAAKASGDQAIPFDQAIGEIEKNRR